MKNIIFNKKMMKYVIPLIITGIAIITIHLSLTFAAETETGTSLLESETGLAFVGAGLAVGIAGVGAGIAVAGATSAGAAAIVERPESFVYILIFAGLGEGIAIYGLVVAIMILGKI